MANFCNRSRFLVAAACAGSWLLGGCLQSRSLSGAEPAEQGAEPAEAMPGTALAGPPPRAYGTSTPYPYSSAAASPVPAARPGLLVVESPDGAMRVLDSDGAVVAELPAFEDLVELNPGNMVVVQALGDHVLLSRDESNGYSYGYPSPSLPAGSTVQYAMLLRRSDFQLLWQRKSAPLRYADPVRLGPTGYVSIGEAVFDAETPPRTIVKAPGGEEQILDDVRPLSPPEAGGWLAVRSGTATIDVGGVQVFDFGFVRPGEPGMQRLSERHILDPLLPFEPEALAGPAFHYLATGAGGTLLLVHETPHAVERIALGTPPAGTPQLQPGARSWLVSVHDPGGAQRPWVSATASGEVNALDLPDARAVQAVWHASGDWFNVSHGDDRIWSGWLDAATSTFKPVPAAPEGLRPFDGDECTSTRSILDDGRRLLPLRDDRLAGVYLEDGDGGFTRVGAPIRDAVRVNVEHAGATLVLDAVDSLQSYTCQASSAWPETDVAEDVLVGGQTQFVRGDRSLVLDTRSDLVLLDPSGRHVAARAEQGLIMLHDLERGSALVLDDAQRVLGWL